MNTLEETFEYLTDRGKHCFEKQSMAMAERLFKLAHFLAPDHEGVNASLGNIYLQVGHLDEAIAHYRRAGESAPVLGNIGAAYLQKGQMKEAAGFLQEALEVDPNHTHSLNNLGHVYRAHGKNGFALKCYQKAYDNDSSQPAFIINLANANMAKGELEKAREWLEYGIEVFPDYPEFHNNLGNVWNKLGEVKKAQESYQKMLDVQPNVSAAANKTLVSLYDLDNDPLTQRKEAEENMGVLDLDRIEVPHYNHDKPRIGFLSAHFGKHPVGFFTTGLFIGNEELDYYVYSNRYDEDEVTKEVQKHTCYRSIHGLSEEQVCNLILQDEIDILVDCGGLSGKNHITIFKRKPAPVQIGWVGYAGTRGLKEIDYLITDYYHTPQGFEGHYTETPLRMPNDYVTYFPPEIEIEKEGGPFTFIASHNSAKINERVLSLWGRILQRTPDTRLLMAYSGLKANSRRILEFLDSYDIDRDRITIHDRLSHTEMMKLYNKADLCLDTWPYSAGLVACESLWMGVPVITMPSNMFSGRHAMSHLKNLDMDEFICYNERDYIEKAVKFTERTRNDFLPKYIRENMTMSPLMNYEQFAHNFNSKMWEIWS